MINFLLSVQGRKHVQEVEQTRNHTRRPSYTINMKSLETEDGMQQSHYTVLCKARSTDIITISHVRLQQTV